MDGNLTRCSQSGETLLNQRWQAAVLVGQASRLSPLLSCPINQSVRPFTWARWRSNESPTDRRDACPTFKCAFPIWNLFPDKRRHFLRHFVVLQRAEALSLEPALGILRLIAARVDQFNEIDAHLAGFAAGVDAEEQIAQASR